MGLRDQFETSSNAGADCSQRLLERRRLDFTPRSVGAGSSSEIPGPGPAKFQPRRVCLHLLSAGYANRRGATGSVGGWFRGSRYRTWIDTTWSPAASLTASATRVARVGPRFVKALTSAVPEPMAQCLEGPVGGGTAGKEAQRKRP